MKRSKFIYIIFLSSLAIWLVAAGTKYNIDNAGIAHLKDIITEGPYIDVRNYGSLNAAILAIGSTQTTLLIPNRQSISSSLTVPGNIHIYFLPGGSITTNAEGIALTINGDVVAGDFQIFSGNGPIRGLKKVNLMWFGARADGSTDDALAIEKALGSMPSVGGTLFAPSNIYAYSTSPNFGKPYLKLIGEKGTVFKHTGSGNAFIADGHGIVNGANDLWFENIILQGNSKSTNGFYFREISRSHFINLKVTGCSIKGSALFTKWSMLNTWTNFTVSANELGNFAVRPLNGIFLTQEIGLGQSTLNTFINPIIEGVGGDGVVVDYAYGNQFIGGTSEGNFGNGITLTNNSNENVINGMNFEANRGLDISVSGNHNEIFNALPLPSIAFTGTNNVNRIIGGRFNDVTIGPGSTGTIISGAVINGKYKDSGVLTGLSQVWSLGIDSNFHTSNTIMSKILGISASTTEAKNITSQITILESATTGKWVFPTPESDTNYDVVCNPSALIGIPVVGSNRPLYYSKDRNSVVLHVESAPGPGNNVIFDCILVHR